MKPIYLDYAATTPIDPRVAEKMQQCLTLEGDFGNPASLHEYGRVARDKIEEARAQVAAYLQADPQEIIWTSGATEAINLALKGAAHLYRRKGKHLITMKTEHKATLDTCQQLEKEGYAVTYLPPKPDGLLDLDLLAQAMRDDTIIVSVMQVNNETGVIQPLDKIAEITNKQGCLLHVDAAQTPGKLALDVSRWPIDLISMCAHKAYGPKGIGALYLRKKPRVRVEPLIHGGGHEQGMRSGTLATHQIVGMGAAFELAQAGMIDDVKQIRQLREQLANGLAGIDRIHWTVPPAHTVPHIANFRCDGMLAEAVLAHLPMIATSTAAACQGKGTEGSYVLRALGLTQEQSKSAVRISMGRFTTPADISMFVDAMQQLFQ